MINKIIRRLFYGNKADSKAYIEYLRGLGMKIGEETTIYIYDICGVGMESDRE